VTSRLVRPSLPSLAYDLDVGSVRPNEALVFCHGFASIRGGEKATLLRDLCRARGRSFLTFDARAHGESEGTMRDFTFSGYLDDLAAMLDGPGAAFDRVVLVGSSLGGAAALHRAATTPKRIEGCVAIAPAFGFAKRYFEATDPSTLEEWRRSGSRRVRNEWVEVDLGYAFLTDGAAYDSAAVAAALKTPTLLIHGTRDEIVPYAVSVDFLEKTAQKDVRLEAIDGGDHRLSATKETVTRLVDAFAEERFKEG
jgi:uncharacterized protein